MKYLCMYHNLDRTSVLCMRVHTHERTQDRVRPRVSTGFELYTGIHMVPPTPCETPWAVCLLRARHYASLISEGKRLPRLRTTHTQPTQAPRASDWVCMSTTDCWEAPQKFVWPRRAVPCPVRGQMNLKKHSKQIGNLLHSILSLTNYFTYLDSDSCETKNRVVIKYTLLNLLPLGISWYNLSPRISS